MEHYHFLHSTLDGYFCCFHMLGDPNNAALNMGLDVSFQCPVFNRDTAKCGIAWSQGSSVSSFTGIFFGSLYWSLPIYTSTNSAGAFCFLSALSFRECLLTFWGSLFWLLWAESVVVWFSFHQSLLIKSILSSPFFPIKPWWKVIIWNGPLSVGSVLN